MCRDEPEKAADLILLLWDKVEKLTAIVEEQGKEIATLKAKLAKNSQNSSKPPSTDKSNPRRQAISQTKDKAGQKNEQARRAKRPQGNHPRKAREPRSHHRTPGASAAANVAATCHA